MSSFRERAFLVCRTRSGQLVPGQVVTGEERSVSFPGAGTCPAGANPVAVAHTHPPDNSILPSDQDLAETRRHGLAHVCVIHRGRAACYATGLP